MKYKSILDYEAQEWGRIVPYYRPGTQSVHDLFKTVPEEDKYTLTIEMIFDRKKDLWYWRKI